MLRLERIAAAVALAAVLGLASLPQTAQAATCPKTHGSCTATITTSVWTGTPTIFCQAGVDVIRIQVALTCDQCGPVPVQSVLRCANTCDDVTFEACGALHTVGLKGQNTWAQALSDCSVIQYRNQ